MSTRLIRALISIGLLVIATDVVLTILLAAVVPRQPAGQRAENQPSLRAGAARVDITPSQGELPKNSRGILDRL